jgi:hypothetical protein
MYMLIFFIFVSVWSARAGVKLASFPHAVDAHMAAGDAVSDGGSTMNPNHFVNTPPVNDAAIQQRLALDLTPPDTPRDMSGREDSADPTGDNAATDNTVVGSGDVEIGEEAGPVGEGPVDTLGPLPSPKDFIDRVSGQVI